MNGNNAKTDGFATLWHVTAVDEMDCICVGSGGRWEALGMTVYFTFDGLDPKIAHRTKLQVGVFKECIGDWVNDSPEGLWR
jgi:hypothetical protein